MDTKYRIKITLSDGEEKSFMLNKTTEAEIFYLFKLWKEEGVILKNEPRSEEHLVIFPNSIKTISAEKVDTL